MENYSMTVCLYRLFYFSPSLFENERLACFCVHEYVLRGWFHSEQVNVFV